MRLVYKPSDPKMLEYFEQEDVDINNFNLMYRAALDYVTEALPVVQGFVVANGIKPSKSAWITRMDGYTSLLSHKMIYGKILELGSDQDPELFYGFVLNQFDAVMRGSSARHKLINTLLEMYPNE